MTHETLQTLSETATHSLVAAGLLVVVGSRAGSGLSGTAEKGAGCWGTSGADPHAGRGGAGMLLDMGSRAGAGLPRLQAARQAGSGLPGHVEKGAGCWGASGTDSRADRGGVADDFAKVTVQPGDGPRPAGDGARYVSAIRAYFQGLLAGKSSPPEKRGVWARFLSTVASPDDSAAGHPPHRRTP